MKIAIGCDPNAQREKEALIDYIKSRNYGEVTDFGSDDPVYAHVACAVGEAVASKEYDRGVLLCGTGLGMSIAANKVKGAYAALCSDVYSAERARLSNDANIICFGAFTSGGKVREKMTDAFFTNEFVPGCSSQPKVDAYMTYDRER
ncbi:MAG: RpiB/LacA/LacB family sugar-phosphate isomerase [Lachnospiraceae bacterium]|nr:RpiB/LacA/LacB family sugar-phosphate isomerase [Lachnospiraceae bacterium]